MCESQNHSARVVIEGHIPNSKILLRPDSNGNVPSLVELKKIEGRSEKPTVTTVFKAR